MNQSYNSYAAEMAAQQVNPMPKKQWSEANNFTGGLFVFEAKKGAAFPLGWYVHKLDANRSVMWRNGPFGSESEAQDQLNWIELDRAPEIEAFNQFN